MSAVVSLAPRQQGKTFFNRSGLRALRQLQGFYRAGFRPTTQTCEREILAAWIWLCEEVAEGRPDSLVAQAQRRLMADYVVLRRRATRAQLQVVPS